MNDSILEGVMGYVSQLFGGLLGETGETGAVLMVMGDGLDALKVPPDEQIEPGEVYAHIPMGGDRRTVFKVIDTTGHRAGEWVRVSKAPGSRRYLVTGAVGSKLAHFWQDLAGRGDSVPRVAHHHEQHHAAGDDRIMIDWKQIAPLALVPYPGELRVRVVRGFYRRGDTLHYLAHGLVTADLSTYKPAGADDARIVMVCMDPDTQALSYSAGTTFTIDRTKTAEDTEVRDVWTHAPAAIPAGTHALGFVLVMGRASFTEFHERYIQCHVGVETVTSATADQDERVKVSASDAAADYLAQKLAAGDGVTLTEETDPGTGAKSLRIDADGSSGGGDGGPGSILYLYFNYS
jgi:hypothetical protein